MFLELLHNLDNVDDTLAETVNEFFREGISDEKYNDLMKSVARPENCVSLTITRANQLIWDLLSPQTRSFVSVIQHHQETVVKASCNITNLLNTLCKLKPDLGDDCQQEMHSCIDLGIDSLALLSQYNKMTNVKRKELQRFDLSPEYHHFSSPSIPFTDMLYGDNVHQKSKEIQDMNRLGRNLNNNNNARGRGNGFSRGDTVEHCHLEFIDNSIPTQSLTPYQRIFDKGQEKIINDEIENLKKLGVIVEVSFDTDQYISPIFTVRKKNTNDHRVILNLKELNKFIIPHHFKMDTFEMALKLVKPNCFFSSIDLRHAYYSVPIAEEHQKLLRFIWKNTIFQYTCLPNGLLSATRIFTKLMKPVFATLRQFGYMNVAYIDDSLLLGDTEDECIENVQNTNDLMDRCLQKIQKESAEVPMIVPLWPTQTWYPLLLEMLIDYPIMLPRKKRLLCIPGTEKIHPLHNQLKFLACRLSGQIWKTKVFQTRLPKSFWRLGHLMRTAKARGNSQKLFISYVKPFKAVSREPISRRIKTVMSKSVINLKSYSSHSTRSAVVSKAFHDLIPDEGILRRAGWTSEKTFAKFHKKPIESHEQRCQRAVLST
ncbi:unnamed protein product [Mytilus edulis]|uniref:Reverse transcriptase domain-containing protein n=1 Tax=Mytilus edulis TaxID=6550 RepID=A0A8S3QMH0_MYTED|nr:unnamed protein product [Mytilus edulis]